VAERGGVHRRPRRGHRRHPRAGLAEVGRYIDEGAEAAGRDPATVRRLLNIGDHFTPDGSLVLVGPLGQWAEQLAQFGEEVAPAVRELVEKART
jgi:hypothetical protein